MTRKFALTLILGTIIILGVRSAVAQKAGHTDPKVEAEITKLVRDYYDAWARVDEKAVMSFMADDGFYFSTRNGYETFDAANQQFRAYFKKPESSRPRFSYQIDDIKVMSAAADTAIANYKIVTKMTDSDGSRDYVERYTNIFAKRQGVWKLIAEHSSDLPKPLADVVAGMPTGWVRTPAGNAERYGITVDTAVKHSGNASAMLTFACGDTTGFGSLAQSISAEEHVGKRIRLSGWLKSENAEQAGLWMRLDGINRMLGFDNMLNRPVKGTSDWKEYTVVLDVPAGTVNILFGTILVGTGRVWVDDFKIETVGKDVPTTNMLSDDEMKAEIPNRAAKKSVSKQLVNPGFENGAHQ